MKKTELVNMVMRLDGVVKLTQCARLVLIAIAWRANEDGVLRKQNGELIPFSYCGRDVDVKGSSLARTLNELAEKGLIRRFKKKSGCLNVEEVSRLYGMAEAQWRDEVEEEEKFEGEETSQIGRSTHQIGRSHLPNWEDINNIYTHTHIDVSNVVGGDEVVSLSEGGELSQDGASSVGGASSGCASSEGASQGTQGGASAGGASQFLRQFYKCYPKRRYMNWDRTVSAWNEALGRGWHEVDMVDALANAMGRLSAHQQQQLPNVDEFIRQEQMRVFLPVERLVERFPEDAAFYSRVAERVSDGGGEVLESVERLAGKRVSSRKRYEDVVGYQIDLPGEIV